MLTTMYAPPRLPDPPLRRERLTERLRAGVQDTPLTLVSGLAGSGKTTLAADWMEYPGVPWRVVWLTLSEATELPEDFWFFVTEALRRAGVELPHSAGVPARQPAGDDLVIRLATDLLDRDEPVVLVLDEVERLTGPDVPRQLELLLRLVGAEPASRPAQPGRPAAAGAALPDGRHHDADPHRRPGLHRGRGTRAAAAFGHPPPR